MIRMTIEEAKPIAVLTKAKYVKRLPGLEHLTASFDGLPENTPDSGTALDTHTHATTSAVSDISGLLLASEKYTESFQPAVTSLDDLAYVVYSSGTTGKPKGILCPHRGAVFSYLYRHQVAPFSAGERVACNIFFVWELLIPLICGIPIYIVPDAVIADPPVLCRYIQTNKITRILFTPSLLETILETCSKDSVDDTLSSLRIVWLNGEVVTEKLQQRAVEALPWVRVMNLYSISECHDVALCDLTRDWQTRGKRTGGAGVKESQPTYGNQTIARTGDILPGVVVFILDAEMKLVPKGVPGQIYVAGPTLARGYFNRELTEKRFIKIPDELRALAGNKPLYDGRMYFTGDWGYIRVADGGLQICGRCDTMVKIRGYSIEIQAVEACLQNSGLVQACAVIVHGREGEDKRLVAYLLPSSTLVKVADSPGDTVTMKKEVRAYMKKMLPFYMIPAQFIFVRDMPTSERSGKLDKSKLPDPDQVLKSELPSNVAGGQRPILSEQNSADRGMPTDADEQTVANIWSEVLGTTYIDVHENFFDLGGHSLTAVRMLAKINKAFRVTIVIDELFQNATVSELAELVQIKRGEMSNIGAGANDNESGTNDMKVLKERRQSVSRRRMQRHISGAHHLDLQKEVEKHDHTRIDADIQLRSFWRSLRMPERWIRCQVLVTGATGYLGAFILAQLLMQTKTIVYCLVKERQGGALQSKERLRETLVGYGLLLPENNADSGADDDSDDDDRGKNRGRRDHTPTPRQKEPGSSTESATKIAENNMLLRRRLARAFAERVTAVRGDVSLNNLGMNDEDYVALSTDVDCVIHCAAYVNLLYPYVAMHGPNVQGTANVLQFATVNKIKALHYISTNGVFPYSSAGSVEFEESPRQLNTFCDKLLDGYSQSKWVAEQLVWRAVDRGLPAVVYRPGNLGPAGSTGACNVNDFNLLFTRACVALNAVPALDGDHAEGGAVTIEWTPVDFVANMVVHVALLAPTVAAAGGRLNNAVVKNRPVQPDVTHMYGKAFHLVNSQRLSFEQMHKALVSSGYGEAVKMVPTWTDWLNILRQYLKHHQAGLSVKSDGTALTMQQLAQLVMPSTVRLLTDSMGSKSRSISESEDDTFFATCQSPAAAVVAERPKMFTSTGAQFSLANTRALYLQPNCIEYPALNMTVMKNNIRMLQRLKLLGAPLAAHGSNENACIEALFGGDKYFRSILRGRLAIVTGASSGIGRATAVMLARCGVLVGAVARRRDRLDELVAESDAILPLVADVCMRDELVNAVRLAEEHFGCRTRVLINCAGVMYYTYMKNLLADQWDHQIDVNCNGAVNAVYAVLPSMMAENAGDIVNISSDAGRRGFAGLAVYSGTKFFIEGWSQAMRHELKQFNIRITCVQPGDVRTELNLYSTDEEARIDCDGGEKMEIMAPNDIARAIVFALHQPAHVAVNEILIEPTQAPI